MNKRLLSLAAAVVVGTALAGGIAAHGIPGAGSVINGCYQKNEGQLRLIDPHGRCRPSEVAIAWSVKGEKGDKGDPGAPGKDGRDGVDGVDGADGADGTGVTVEPEAPGANCPAGGAKLTAANGSAYVCSALPPDPGLDG